MRTETETLAAGAAAPITRLDDIVLDDAVFRVLALAQKDQAQATPPAALATIAQNGRARATVRRWVPGDLAPQAVAALGRSAAADAVVRALAAPIRFPDMVLHASWSAGSGAASAPAVGNAVTRAVAQYCAEIGLTHTVTDEAEKSRRGWLLQADAASAPGAAAWPLALNAAETDSALLLVDLADGMYRVQGGALARAYAQDAQVHPDGVPDGAAEDHLTALAAALETLRAEGRVLAYGARGEGGLLAAVAEMALAGQVGVALNVDLLVIDGDGVSDGRMDSGEVKNWTQQISGRRAELTLRALFAEEAGAVLQIRRADCAAVMEVLRAHGLAKYSNFIGKTRPEGAATDQGKGELTIWRDAAQVFGATLADLAHADPAQRAAQRTGAAVGKQPDRKRELTHEEKIKAMRMGL